MRIIHLGDLHCRSTHPYNGDRLDALDQAIHKATSTGRVDLWVFPGDLFDGRNPSSVADRNALAPRLIQMADVAPVEIVPGNHDIVGDLRILSMLKAAYPIHVSEFPQTVTVTTPRGARLAVFALPYPWKAGFVSAGVPHEQLHAETQKAMDLLFMEAAHQIQTLMQSGCDASLMIGHVSVGGALASVGQPQIGTELEITQAHLDRLGPIPKLLNHIHKHQDVGGAVYAGSLCRLDWGEVEKKGFVEWHILPVSDTSGFGPMWQVNGQWKWAWVFQPLNIPPRYDVICDIDDDGEIRFVSGPGHALSDWPTSWKGCDVRVRLRYPEADRPRLDDWLTWLYGQFSAARRCDIEPIVQVTRAIRAPEVVAAPTFEAKLKALCALQGVAWDETLQRAADRLLATEDGDAVVAAVSAELGDLHESSDDGPTAEAVDVPVGDASGE